MQMIGFRWSFHGNDNASKECTAPQNLRTDRFLLLLCKSELISIHVLRVVLPTHVLSPLPLGISLLLRILCMMGMLLPISRGGRRRMLLVRQNRRRITASRKRRERSNALGTHRMQRRSA
jgi:hypothetical protein